MSLNTKGAAPTKENNAPHNFSSFDSTINTVLNHLERVKQTGSDKWQASCPTSLHQHGDRSQGLSLKQAEDGRVLLHCHAGCAADSIVSAIGLSLSDLFPKDQSFQPKRGPSRRAIEAAQLEAEMAFVFVELVAHNKPLNPGDKASFQKAVDRLKAFGRML